MEDSDDDATNNKIDNEAEVNLYRGRRRRRRSGRRRRRGGRWQLLNDLLRKVIKSEKLINLSLFYHIIHAFFHVKRLKIKDLYCFLQLMGSLFSLFIFIPRMHRLTLMTAASFSNVTMASSLHKRIDIQV